MASNLVALASNLIAMASKTIKHSTSYYYNSQWLWTRCKQVTTAPVSPFWFGFGCFDDQLLNAIKLILLRHILWNHDMKNLAHIVYEGSLFRRSTNY